MRRMGQSARRPFSYVAPEEGVPQRHPLRCIRSIVEEAPESLAPSPLLQQAPLRPGPQAILPSVVASTQRWR